MVGLPVAVHVQQFEKHDLVNMYRSFRRNFGSIKINRWLLFHDRIGYIATPATYCDEKEITFSETPGSMY